MSQGSIMDRRVRLYPSKLLLQLLSEYNEYIREMPENVAAVLKQHGFSVSSNVELLERDNGDVPKKTAGVNMKLLNQLVKEGETAIATDNSVETDMGDKEPTAPTGEEDASSHSESKPSSGDGKTTTARGCFYLNDLRWLNGVLAQLRSEKKTELFLHNLLESCSLELPLNAIIPRDPELEERCQKLRQEQQNIEYRKITKNVDSVLKNYPEDSISYQMKVMNSQIIAVLQFVFSVVAGFVFGFLGVQLIIGNLDFGFRLLLGIICALVIALAEIYFLAKKLNEYDDVDAVMRGLPGKKKKAHID